MILPGTGRGTMRSMVEGGCRKDCVFRNAVCLSPHAPSTSLRLVPLPASGEDL